MIYTSRVAVKLLTLHEPSLEPKIVDLAMLEPNLQTNEPVRAHHYPVTVLLHSPLGVIPLGWGVDEEVELNPIPTPKEVRPVTKLRLADVPEG